MQGSAVTGKSHETGIPFDVGRVSDFDVALVGDDIFEKAKSLGLTKISNSGPIEAGSDAAKALGIDGMLQDLSNKYGRKVNVMIF